MTIPKSAIDARVIFPVVDRIPNALLILVSPKNKLLISYKSSMNPTPIGILHKKVAFEATKGSSKVVKDKKTKKQTKKPKVVKVEVSYQTVHMNSGKGVLEKIKKFVPEKQPEQKPDKQPREII